MSVLDDIVCVLVPAGDEAAAIGAGQDEALLLEMYCRRRRRRDQSAITVCDYVYSKPYTVF